MPDHTLIPGDLHMNLDGNEARYAMAMLRYRLGLRSSRPGPGHYLGRNWETVRTQRIEDLVDALLDVARS